MDRDRGFSLLEVLFATTVLTVALAGLAHLFAVATRANSSARATTYAAILAQQKMEQLRNLTYAFDSLGVPRTDFDTDISMVPELPNGGTGLQPSPAGALGANTVGYVDYLDANGRSLGGLQTKPPPGAVYIRRWSVEPLPINPNNTIVLQVLVTRARNRGVADSDIGVVTRLPDEARIVTVKTRKAS
jgi:prepilin-type N-terminal cleavage/methylation domain-containing protein